MKKFIKGMFDLDENINDLVSYENTKIKKIEEVIDWADNNDVGVTFGTLEDNTYVCEYLVYGRTMQGCKGSVAELKALLKEEWKKISVRYQGHGDTI